MTEAPASLPPKANRRHSWLLMLGLAIVAAALYLPGLGRVQATIWDEAYYLSTTARYAQGQAHFAAHPPLGTMLIAAGTLGLGENDRVDWQPIGAERAAAPAVIPPNFDWRGARLLPALFGIAGIVLFCGLLLELTGSLITAGLFAVLLVFDTAIAVQVRSAQLDAFQLAFVLAALWALARAWRTDSSRALFAFGALLTAAALVRANAAVLGILAVPIVWRIAAAHEWTKLLRVCLAGSAGALMAASLTLTAYLAATPNPPDPGTTMGKLDLPYFSPEQAEAQAQGRLNPARFPAAVLDIVAFMRYDLGMMPADKHASRPWQWLLARGFIPYRSNAEANPPWSIGLIPNLLVWLISLGGVIACLFPGRLANEPLRALFLLGWLASFAALLAVNGLRVLYLYNYFIPLLFGLALGAMEWKRSALGLKPAVFVALLAGAYGAWRLPFALGLPMP